MSEGRGGVAREAIRRLLPAPREVERGAGAFRFRPGLVIRAGDGDGDDGAGLAAARLLAARLEERCPGIGPEVAAVSRAAPAPGLSIEAGGTPDRLRDPTGGTSSPPAEGFDLLVGEAGIRLVGGDRRGVRYGVEALAQLTGRDGVAPAVRIRDAPALERRAFMLDISRGRVPRLAAVRDLVRLLARLRYNELLLYTEHTFRFTRHPAIGDGSGGYRAEEILKLDAFAAAEGVRLTPCLQTFGHMRRILEKDAYRGLAETEKLWSVSPEAPGTYRLLEDLLDEYLPLFRSGEAHLNCDEPIDLGEGLSRARAERDGPAAVFAGHVNRVASVARRLGKRPMIWADVLADHPEALELLDEDIVLCDWWYEADHDFDRVKRFRDAGREFLTTAGSSSWTSLFPRLDTALPNIRGHARAARRYGASGFILTDWGDGGHYNFFSGSLFPLAAGAEAAWGDPMRPEAELAAAFSEHVAGDRSGFAGAFSTRLGRLHDVGFPHFNHSPLKTVIFETGIGDSERTPTREALTRTRGGLRALSGDVGRHGLPPDPIGREWLWALQASLLAAERGLAILDHREAGTRAERARACAGLQRVAGRQRALRDRFRRIWLASYRPEGIETALALHDGAVRALFRAAAGGSNG